MVTKLDTDEALLKRIDNLQLSNRLFQLKDAMFSAPRIISVDRARLAMESWKETEGEDIELRRAKLFKKVLEGTPIAIHDFDIVVGRETEHLIGAPVFVDETGDVIPGLWDEGDSLSRAMVFQGAETKNTLRECSRFFAGVEYIITMSPQGKAGFKQFFEQMFKAMPDFRYTIKKIVAEGDIVMMYSTTTATHSGEWLGNPPTGNKLNFDVVDIFRIQDRKIAEHWDVADTLKLFTQVGKVSQ